MFNGGFLVTWQKSSSCHNTFAKNIFLADCLNFWLHQTADLLIRNSTNVNKDCWVFISQWYQVIYMFGIVNRNSGLRLLTLCNRIIELNYSWLILQGFPSPPPHVPLSTINSLDILNRDQQNSQPLNRSKPGSVR